MPRDRRLEWTQKNRARRDRVQSAGSALKRVVEDVAVTGQAAAWEAAEAVAGLVDGEFAAHCRITVAGGRRVIVYVDDPVLVQPLRARWLLRLREALITNRGHGSAREIVFAYGREGIRIASE